MKQLPKLNQMVLLFLSSKNPIFSRMRYLELGKIADDLEDKTIQGITGTSHTNRQHWRDGRRVQPTRIQAMLKETLAAIDKAAAKGSKNPKAAEVAEELRGRVNAFGASISDPDKIDPYKSAYSLGIDILECQKIIDAQFYEDFPLFCRLHYLAPTVGYESSDLADRDLKQYEGVYSVLVRRGPTFIKAVLRVRYLLSSGKGRFIRCKMNFPQLDINAPGEWDGDQYVPAYSQYDGTLAIRDSGNGSGRVFWIFEKRQLAKNDYFFFITGLMGPARGPHAEYLSGQYLTTGQDLHQSVVSDRLLLKRLMSTQGQPKHPEYRRLMRQGQVLRDKSDIQAAQREFDLHTEQLFPAV